VRLADCFIEVLAYAKLFLRKPNDDYANFRRRVEELLRKSRALAERAGHAVEDYQNALFAVVVFIDESVLTSGWPEAAQWRKDTLQKQQFGTTRGGVEFFERLDRIPAPNKPVREVYYFCLMLGFQGQHVYRQDKTGLEVLKQQTLSLLVEESARGGPDSEQVLFPDAYPSGPAPVRAAPAFVSRATLAALLVPPLAVLALYLLYVFLINQVGGSFLMFVK
jgi:type VI secretion system protein ImpK